MSDLVINLWLDIYLNRNEKIYVNLQKSFQILQAFWNCLKIRRKYVLLIFIIGQDRTILLLPDCTKSEMSNLGYLDWSTFFLLKILSLSGKTFYFRPFSIMYTSAVNQGWYLIHWSYERKKKFLSQKLSCQR